MTSNVHPAVERIVSGHQTAAEGGGSDDHGDDVGVPGNGAYDDFSPPTIRIDSGTTVTWTWTGQGGTHNVVAVEGSEFESRVDTRRGPRFGGRSTRRGPSATSVVPTAKPE
jgi:plastocyanin